MKKRPSLVLREPVKLYETKVVDEIKPQGTEKKGNSEKEKLSSNLEILLKEKIIEPISSTENKVEPITSEETISPKVQNRETLRQKMSPRIQQIWDYFAKKAKTENEIKKSFSITRAEVMREANIGSTNTYRDALRKFQDLNLMEVELRPGVNSGSIFTLTEKGIEEIS